MQSKKIAITGGIGSGKSAVSQIIQNAGYPVFSCDKIYADLSFDPEYLEKLKKLFPDCVKDGKLLRNALSEKVFSDKKSLETLNALSHPLIMARLEKEMEKFPLAFAEVPLLFEGGYEAQFDEVIVVMRALRLRIESVKARDHLTENEIVSRINRQFNYENLPENCLVIENNGTLFDLQESTQKILHKIL